MPPAPQGNPEHIQEIPMKFISTIALLLILFSTNAAAQAGFGALYYDGDVVGTVVPPAAAPMTGKDPIYPITNGVADQLPVAGVGPGDSDYHGGKWAVHLVTFLMGVEPYLLTSEHEIMDAYDAGDITITRAMEADFKCPIQRKPKG
jgi:hypothetical protein